MSRIRTLIATSTLTKVKNLIVLFLLVSLIIACSQSNDNLKKGKQMIYTPPSDVAQDMENGSELTTEQQAAFDALNTLQVSTDEMNRLYSTFAGNVQNCYPPDTSLTISQKDFLIAMKQFVASNCKNLPVAERNELAARSVLAQEEYTVLLCLDNTAPASYESATPMIGTWVMTNILGQRDVIIVW